MQDGYKNEDIDGQLLLFDKYSWLKPAEDNLYNVNQGGEDPPPVTPDPIEEDK